MKKWVNLILVVVLVISLVGCNKNSDVENVKEETTVEETTIEETTVEETTIEIIEDDSASNMSFEEFNEILNNTYKQEFPFEETKSGIGYIYYLQLSDLHYKVATNSQKMIKYIEMEYSEGSLNGIENLDYNEFIELMCGPDSYDSYTQNELLSYMPTLLFISMFEIMFPKLVESKGEESVEWGFEQIKKVASEKVVIKDWTCSVYENDIGGITFKMEY